MIQKIRIGTRASELALWQANTVAGQLNHFGFETEIITINSLGDLELEKPLYELGVTGVFTKSLDIALLQEKIDIAVHSLKDVPTTLPEGIVQVAVLKRGNHNDVLVLKENEHFFSNEKAIIATGSLRRKAQWLHRYPNHSIVGLRGNVNTRLQKLAESQWDGAIFAAAGLRRLKLLPKQEKHINLDWMVPAPAQGAVMIAALEKNQEIIAACAELNDETTALCVHIEREFLKHLEGGCTAPIGALATVREEELKFKGALFSHDGKHKIEFTKKVPVNNVSDLGEFAAQFILERGGKKLMRKEIHIDKETLIFSTKHLSIAQTSVLSSKIGVDMSDFITIRYNRIKPQSVKKTKENVVFTSQNAVLSLLQSVSAIELDFKNIYCVGRRTKRLIEKKIGKVAHVENTAEALASYLVKNLKEKQITFFCGNLSRTELPQILENNNIEVEKTTVYKTLLTPKKILEKHKGILFFSPSAIESFLLENAPLEIPVFCIGATTAKEAKKHFSNVVTAKLPTVESVLNEVNSYYKNNAIDV